MIEIQKHTYSNYSISNDYNDDDDDDDDNCELQVFQMVIRQPDICRTQRNVSGRMKCIGFCTQRSRKRHFRLCCVLIFKGFDILLMP